MQSRTPFSTEGMKLRGTAPPKMSSTNSKPPPRGIGSPRSPAAPRRPPRPAPGPRVAVLAAPAGLLLVLALALGTPLHRFLVGDARRQEVHVDVVLALTALDDHLDVQAAHARHQELLGLRVK